MIGNSLPPHTHLTSMNDLSLTPLPAPLASTLTRRISMNDLAFQLESQPDDTNITSLRLAMVNSVGALFSSQVRVCVPHDLFKCVGVIMILYPLLLFEYLN